MPSTPKVRFIRRTGYMVKLITEAGKPPTVDLIGESTLSNPAKSPILDKLNAVVVNLVHGNLYDHQTLVEATKEVDAVNSTVGHMQIVDEDRIISAIKEAGNMKEMDVIFTVDDDYEKSEDALGDAQVVADGSINANEGHIAPSVLKLVGRMKNRRVEAPITNRRVIFLVDTGSSYNIINEKKVNDLDLLTQALAKLIHLAVADDREVIISQFCPELNWQMDGSSFCANFLVMKTRCDAILGAEWLKTLGVFSMDLNSPQFIEFQLNGELVRLTGLNSGTHSHSDAVGELVATNE